MINLNIWIFSVQFSSVLEKEMATPSSTLAWRIPWREEPGRLQSMGSQKSDFTFTLLLLQFSFSVVSDSFRHHESQHVRPPCPSPTPRVHPNSCLLSQWCHPAISSSVVHFFSCPQSLPASESFKWVSSSHQVAKVLEFELQHQSFQWTPRTDFL